VNRRTFLSTMGAGIFTAPLVAEAQDPAKVVRIGWLGLASPGPQVLRIVDAFKQGLRQLGYVEGQNVAFEYRWAHGRSERLPDLAAELVLLKVDIIAVANTLGVLAAKQATRTIPIIFLGADPDALGLGSSLARPGGNITGVTLVAGPEIGGKYLQLLKEAVPESSRVAVLVRPENSSHALVLKEIEAAARSLKVQLQPVRARTPDDLDTAFSAMARLRVDALIVLADPIFFLHRERLATLAAKNRLPAMYGLTEHAEAGGLMAYSANFAEVARRAATYVDKILKGAKPGDLPIERPQTFELVINLKTAKTLGITIPQPVLLRADQIIE
jgi:putative ABC transport system substrate-binding protein